MDGLHGAKLEAADIFLDLLHDGCFNNDGVAFLGDLQDQMVPFTDFEGDVVK